MLKLMFSKSIAVVNRMKTVCLHYTIEYSLIFFSLSFLVCDSSDDCDSVGSGCWDIGICV